MEGNLQENNNFVNEKNNNSKIIIAVLVTLLVVALGFICYDKFINKEKPPVPTQTEPPKPSNEENSTKEKYAEWMQYILDQNITKIEASSIPCSEDTFDEKTVTLNTEQLKNIFKKFMNYKLQVAYVGGGGWECGESLTIKYQKNGKEYELEYLGTEGHLVPSSDGCATIYDKDLENALNNSADVVVNEEEKGQQYICTMYGILNDGLLLDEYFE